MENSLNINIIIAIVCGIYAAFNLYFMLEKFKIKDWCNEYYIRIFVLFDDYNMLYWFGVFCYQKDVGIFRIVNKYKI